jgi:hypothetical protein
MTPTARQHQIAQAAGVASGLLIIACGLSRKRCPGILITVGLLTVAVDAWFLIQTSRGTP